MSYRYCSSRRAEFFHILQIHYYCKPKPRILTTEPPKKAAPASARATENPHRTAGKRCLTEEIPSFFLSKL
ncbi:hypothetical protein HMPREF0080_00535 [Anaeroglobus geminatus F0357]|uniref:Uncharacterized protein n=1 Tax=Anaeroglobus geminatus F0357 TaxID=861450 RepID=G9YFX3_9FIRM|nr:hypothetical protein HMPREF0080_00535 [Anaeroglobus geminatus F0357]